MGIARKSHVITYRKINWYYCDYCLLIALAELPPDLSCGRTEIKKYSKELVDLMGALGGVSLSFLVIFFGLFDVIL